MKYLLIILTFTALFIAVVSTNNVSLSQKETQQFSLNLEHYIGDITTYCLRPLSPEQIVYGNQKLGELIECGNTTIDIFIAKLDEDVIFDVPHEELGRLARKFAAPVCEVFDDIFQCISPLGSVFDMCLDEREKIFKDKLFGIVPLIHQSACLRNGALFADIVEHEDGVRCMPTAMDGLFDVGFVELTDNNSTEFFGNEKVCQKFNEMLTSVYRKVGECSLGILPMVKDMLGFFCDRTHCDHFLYDIQCY